MNIRSIKPVDSTWESLALVRFFLAMIVIAAHIGYFGQNALMAKFADLSAFTAVVCFLVISGYSIAHSVHRRTDGFYKRRILRVYPLYALAVIAPVAVQGFRGHLLPHMVTSSLQNLLFLQVFTAYPTALNQVVWTLAIEVMLYAAAPLLVQLSSRVLLGITGVSALCYLAYPQLMLHFHLPSPYYAFMPYGGGLLMLAWAWIGGFVYYRFRDNPSAGMVLALSLFGLMSVNSMFTATFSNVTIALTLASLALGRNLVLGPIARKVMAFAGDLSFPLYLLHIPLFHFMSGILHLHSVPLLTVAALVTAAVGIYIDNQVKRPAQVILDATVAAANACGRTTALAVSVIHAAFTGAPSAIEANSMPMATRRMAA